jgi:hypothetical protein
MSVQPSTADQAPAPAPDDIATRLGNRRDGALILSFETMNSRELADLLGAIGVSELALTDPKTPDPNGPAPEFPLTASGNAQLFGADVETLVTFTAADDALSVALHAELAEHTLRLAQLPWASLDGLALDLSVSGPSLAVPIVSASLSGKIELEGVEKPIVITLRPTGGDSWLLRAADIPLPNPVTTLGHLLPGQQADGLLPSTLSEDFAGLEIADLSCVFDPGELTVRSLAITVGAPGKTWHFASGLPGVTGLAIGLALEFPGPDEIAAAAADGDAQGAAGPSFSVVGTATILIDPVKLPLRIAGDQRQWRFGIIGAEGFPKLGDLVTSLAGDETARMLPAAFATFHVSSLTVDVAVAAAGGALQSIFFALVVTDEWVLIDGDPPPLAIERFQLEVAADRVSGDTSGFLRGVIRFGDVDVPVAVEKPAGSGRWTLRLGADAAPKLSGVGALSGAVGGKDVQEHLPGDFGGVVTLKDLTASFGEDHSLESFHLELDSPGPWKLPGDIGIEVEDLMLKLDATPAPLVTGSIRGTIDFGGPKVTLSAAKTTADWELKGELGGGPVDLKALAAKLGGFSVPPALEKASLTTLAIDFRTSGAFSFKGAGSLTMDGTTVDLKLDADIDKTTAKFSGSVTIDGHEFTLALGEDSKETRLVATYAHKETDKIVIRDLVAAVSPPVAAGIPASLELDLQDVIFALAADEGPVRLLFAVDLPHIDFSGLPLVGSVIGEAAGVDDLKVVAATATPRAAAAPDAGDIAVWNQLLQKTSAKPLPAQGIDRGIFVGGKLRLGDVQKAIGAGPPPSTPAPTGGTAAAPATSDQTKWFDVQRSLGPVYVGRVGARYDGDAAKLWLLLDASLSLGGLSLSLMGLGVGSKLSEFSPEVHLDGLGLAFEQDPVEIAGSFLNVPPTGKVEFQYDGAAVVRAESLALSAVGSYAQLKDGHPSFFLFVELDAPLGGPPALYVTGLMGGFGYNRALRIPDQDEVFQFPFVQGIGGGSPSGGAPSGVLSKLEQGTDPWLKVEEGEYWAALGVTFTSFEVVESKALLIAEFGKHLQFALIGLSKLQLPQEGEAFAYLELELEAVLKPDEGFFGLTARVSPNSFVIDRACRLTGGFAFYLWFDGDHAGDFVLTLGGYHPRFPVPAHYPKEPRLGLSWPINEYVSIDGQAYFALTPSCVMGGGGLHVLFHDGNLRAWLTASADFLISWQPFRYGAQVEVSVGISYTIGEGDLQTTLTAELGASLELWGPPTGGKAHVSWYVISFTVSFGADPPGPLTDPTWKDDLAPLLPQKDMCKIAIRSGLLPPNRAGLGENGDAAKPEKPGPWLVRADTLELATECAIPATGLEVVVPTGVGNGTTRISVAEAKQAPAIRPLRLTSFTATHTLEVTGPHGMVDMQADGAKQKDDRKWTVGTRKRDLPKAVWGEPLDPGASPPPSAELVPDQLVGLVFTPPKTTEGAATDPVDLTSRIHELAPGGALPADPRGTAPGVLDTGAVAAVKTIAGADTAARRTAIRSVLEAQGLDPGTDDKLGAFAKAADRLFPVAPMLAVKP